MQNSFLAFFFSTWNKVLLIIYCPLDLYKPVITLRSDTSKQGDPAFIFCKVKGTAPFFISWFKNKQKLANQNEDILSLINVTQSDTGTYTCEAKNQLTKKLSDEVILKIDCKSSFFFFSVHREYYRCIIVCLFIDNVVMFFLLFYGISQFLWAFFFALALFWFEISILEVFIISSPKKQIFQ